MSHAAADLPRRHRLTVADYYRMAEVGILGPDTHVELIDGDIIDMAPPGSLHAATVDRLNDALARAVDDRASVRVQNPVPQALQRAARCAVKTEMGDGGIADKGEPYRVKSVQRGELAGRRPPVGGHRAELVDLGRIDAGRLRDGLVVNKGLAHRDSLLNASAGLGWLFPAV
jgi:hypothetical protein